MNQSHRPYDCGGSPSPSTAPAVVCSSPERADRGVPPAPVRDSRTSLESLSIAEAAYQDLRLEHFAELLLRQNS